MNLSLWLENLAAYSIQIGLFIIAGGLLPALFRIKIPSVMLGYRQILLAVCLALPALQTWSRPSDSGFSATASIRIMTSPVVENKAGSSLTIPETIALVLAAGIAARMFWLALGLYTLRRYRREAQPIASLPEAIGEMKTRLGVEAEFRISTRIGNPATFGWRHPIIVLPAHFLKMEKETQRVIACHELLHVRRRDWLWACAEEIIRAVLWFHPGIWWLLNGIQLSREQAVDQQVLRLTGAREQYLKSLLQIINPGAWNQAMPAPLFLRERQLVRRVALILTEVQMARPRLIASLIVIGGLIFLCGLVVTSAFPLKAAPLPARLESGGTSIADASAGMASPVTQPAAQDEPRIERPPKSPIRLKEGMAAPKLIHGVKAVYPPEAKQRGLQRVVVVEMTVNEKGRVRDARVIEGHPLFDPAALEAVREFRFTPTVIDGAAVPVIVRMEIKFSLTDETHTSREPVRVEGDVQASKLLVKVDPEYPAEAIANRVAGRVILQASIDEQGAVTDAKVLRGHPLLDDAALTAVKQWRYSPTYLNGQAIAVLATVTVVFNPETGQKP